MKKLTSLVMIAALSFLVGCAEQVDEGYRGIKTNWGEVVGEPLEPGLYFYLPIASSIFEMEVREQVLQEMTEAFTADTQVAGITYSAVYYPEPTKIGDLYKQLGKNWDQKLVKSAVQSSLKNAVGMFKADDLVSRREVVRNKAYDEIKTSLAERSIFLTRLDLTNLDFKDEYEAAVEAKVVAIQKAEQAKNRSVEVEENARQTVMMAKANAESMRIRSQALSQNKSLVEYEAVQKWDGKLPQYILGSGAMPFINLNNLGKE